MINYVSSLEQLNYYVYDKYLSYAPTGINFCKVELPNPIIHTTSQIVFLNFLFRKNPIYINLKNDCIKNPIFMSFILSNNYKLKVPYFQFCRELIFNGTCVSTIKMTYGLEQARIWHLYPSPSSHVVKWERETLELQTSIFNSLLCLISLNLVSSSGK